MPFYLNTNYLTIDFIKINIKWSQMRNSLGSNKYDKAQRENLWEVAVILKQTIRIIMKKSF